MNNIANNIKQRLSMREPLCAALDVVVQITDKLKLEKQYKENAVEQFLIKELTAVNELFPTCTNFERDFPSIAFSIATGIGKTRLMAACIAYLYLKKGIRHFFVLAPNLTLYEKLIRDFNDISYSKYAFKGLTEFVHNRPVVITGENYDQARGLFSDTEIQINIFNIAKFNSDNKGGKGGTPKMKRLAECLGQSYYDYLAGLDDLVILMDEAHRYHADASKKAINELRPILGIELTATPIDEKGKAFKNIVFEYNLAQALADGKYVKNPTVAKRKNLERGTLTDKELDVLKLEDAISVHEITKVELELYACNNEVQIIKPFILVACRNIQHAMETVELIENELFSGRYKGKVLQIDSSTKKDEDIDKQFISLENPENEIEIVVHVNMLKEGWDVTNLYTIVPLRAADAMVLIEQTIGRGLRLPYGGKRTGNKEVDKLTIIAHENFEAVLAKAKDPKSLLSKFSFVELDEDDTKERSVVISAKTTIEKKLEKEQEKIKALENEYQRKQAQTSLDAKKAILNVIPQFNSFSGVKSKEDLTKPEVMTQIVKEAEKVIRSTNDNNLFYDQEVEDKITHLNTVAELMIVEYRNNIIEIPRMIIQQQQVEANFDWFDLNTKEGFSIPALQQEIMRINLVDQSEVEILQAKSSGIYGNPIQEIVVQMMNYDDIDYDNNSELLYHLANQAYIAIESYNSDKTAIPQAVHQYKGVIADRIYRQMREHFSLTSVDYIKPKVLPFIEILTPNLTEIISYGYRDYRDIINPPSLVRKYIFRGFEKACHFEYKFDSKTEQDFAYILENDRNVLRWLRPAQNQFRIYWDNNSKRYEPDFVVETADVIYLVETKAQKDIDSKDVSAKKEAAEKYCEYASEYTAEYGGKPWKYVIIAHDDEIGRAHV